MSARDSEPAADADAKVVPALIEWTDGRIQFGLIRLANNLVRMAASVWKRMKKEAEEETRASEQVFSARLGRLVLFI